MKSNEPPHSSFTCPTSCQRIHIDSHANARPLPQKVCLRCPALFLWIIGSSAYITRLYCRLQRKQQQQQQSIAAPSSRGDFPDCSSSNIYIYTTTFATRLIERCSFGWSLQRLFFSFLGFSDIVDVVALFWLRAQTNVELPGITKFFSSCRQRWLGREFWRNDVFSEIDERSDAEVREFIWRIFTCADLQLCVRIDLRANSFFIAQSDIIKCF